MKRLTTVLFLLACNLAADQRSEGKALSAVGDTPFFCSYSSKNVLFIEPMHPDYIRDESDLPTIDLRNYDYEDLEVRIESAIKKRGNGSDRLIVVPVTNPDIDQAMVISMLVRDQANSEKWCPAIYEHMRMQQLDLRNKQMWLDISNKIGP